MFTRNFLKQKTCILDNFCRIHSNISKSNLTKLLKSMPKEPKHVIPAQRQRLKIKERMDKYIPGKVTLQVLGTGAEGAPKSLYMFTDQSRYLFNCGEGTQRLAHEHKMKLSKLEHIFVTHPIWENIGGLPGVSLTIQDVGVPQITLHGPEGLDELFIATKRFVVLRDLEIRMADCNPENKFEDNVMTVTYVPITSSGISEKSESKNGSDTENEKWVQVNCDTADASTSTRSEKNRRKRRSQSCDQSLNDDTDYYAHESKRKRRRSRNRCRSVSGTRSVSPPTKLFQSEREQSVSMCYICRLRPRPGALSLERCVNAGVPPGPLLGQLKAGMDVTLDSGTVVKSKDVCLPDDPGPVIIIVDCPSTDYLDSFIQSDIFSQYQSTATCDDDLAFLVVHFTPSKVMEDIRYKTWIQKFSMSTQHLILNDRNKCMGSAAVHRIQYKLNMLHNDIFPLLGDTGTYSFKNESLSSKKRKIDDMIEDCSIECTSSFSNDIFVHPNTCCNLFLRPKKGLDRSEEVQLEPSQYIDETMAVEGFPEALQCLKEQLNTSEPKNVFNYPRVLFLGTGSCIPNKTRNTSGILIETDEKTSILMDCGEGTYGQLIRFYGYEKAKQVLVNLKAIYISHLHADHHIGLVGLLKGRKKAFENLGLPFEPAMLLAPIQILSWLDFYDRRFEEIADTYNLIANGNMILGDNKLNLEQKELLTNVLGMTEVNTVLVRHCPNAFGAAFIHKNGWKITYSGDTMPCVRLVELGLNSDLLIHEATMEDELAHEAVAKMHSTTSQAIEIGQKMKAKFIMLTHFSQRYAKLPRFNDNFADNVGIAFDNMQVTLNELPLVPLLYPALRLMFAEHYEELECKAVKRQLKRGRDM